jgi:hypothetical protein
MTISTVVVWGENAPTQSQADEICAQAATMASQGKTDDVPLIQQNTPLANQKTVTRTWTTTADAEEWVAFILTYNPVSAEIIP